VFPPTEDHRSIEVHVAAEKTEAIVIRLADFSESSRVVTLFTRQFGKVGAIAKGVKRLKGPFHAALDLLSVCEVVFLRTSSSGLDILTEAHLRQRFNASSGVLNNLYAGYYVAELLDALSEEYDPHPALFDESVDVLGRLSLGAPLAPILLRFELILLREIGQLPSFDQCVVCGESVDVAHKVGFKMSQGGVICRKCYGDEAPRYEISMDAVKVIQRFAEGSPESWQAVSIGSGQLNEIRAVVNSVVRHILGRRPKMHSYLSILK
jgi:DNA repair protein RecO (recombination protein O)